MGSAPPRRSGLRMGFGYFLNQSNSGLQELFDRNAQAAGEIAVTLGGTKGLVIVTPSVRDECGPIHICRLARRHVAAREYPKVSESWDGFCLDGQPRVLWELCHRRTRDSIVARTKLAITPMNART